LLKKFNASLFNILFSAILIYDVSSPHPLGGPPAWSPGRLFALDSLAAARNALNNILTGSSNTRTGSIRFALLCFKAYQHHHRQFSKIDVDGLCDISKNSFESKSVF